MAENVLREKTDITGHITAFAHCFTKETSVKFQTRVLQTHVYTEASVSTLTANTQDFRRTGTWAICTTTAHVHRNFQGKNARRICATSVT